MATKRKSPQVVTPVEASVSITTATISSPNEARVLFFGMTAKGDAAFVASALAMVAPTIAAGPMLDAETRKALEKPRGRK